MTDETTLSDDEISAEPWAKASASTESLAADTDTDDADQDDADADQDDADDA